MARPPNPKMRITGAVLVLLAVLALIGTTTGWDTDGSAAGRVVLGIVGTFLLVIGLVLIRTRTPVVRTLRAEPRGLVIGLGDQPPFTLAWDRVDGVRMRALGRRCRPGYLLSLNCPTPLPRGPLRVFEHRQADESAVIIIGLNHKQSQDMLSQLPVNCPCFQGVGATPGLRLGRHP